MSHHTLRLAVCISLRQLHELDCLREGSGLSRDEYLIFWGHINDFAPNMNFTRNLVLLFVSAVFIWGGMAMIFAQLSSWPS